MDQVLVEDDGPIRHVRLNRPERLNALTPAMHERVIDVVLDAARQDTVRVIALSGEGRAFCSGDDIKGGERDAPRTRLFRTRIAGGLLILLKAGSVIRSSPKPTVVLMHGYAVGAGYDYSLSCDFRVATEDCRYGDPRIHRGLWAAEGWSYKLPRQLHQSAVAPIAYVGDLMTGREAWQRGLVHHVHPPGSDLRFAARPFLQSLAALDAQAYASTKQAILAGLDQRADQALGDAPRFV